MQFVVKEINILIRQEESDDVDKATDTKSARHNRI